MPDLAGFTTSAVRSMIRWTTCEPPSFGAFSGGFVVFASLPCASCPYWRLSWLNRYVFPHEHPYEYEQSCKYFEYRHPMYSSSAHIQPSLPAMMRWSALTSTRSRAAFNLPVSMTGPFCVSGWRQVRCSAESSDSLGFPIRCRAEVLGVMAGDFSLVK